MPRLPSCPALLLAGALLAPAPASLAAGEPAAAPPRPAAGPSAEALSDPKAAERSAKAPEPKLICEQVEQMGSHFRKKVCATAEAWEARRRKDADQMSRMGDQGAGCGGAANPC